LPHSIRAVYAGQRGRIKGILGKLDANDRTHAVIIGLKRGIIEL